IRTKRLGDTVENELDIRVPDIAEGRVKLDPTPTPNRDAGLHFTVIEIRSLFRTFHGRTIGKIRDYLRSMYREDFRQNRLRLRWNGQILTWEEVDSNLAQAADGTRYKKDFSFLVDGKQVSGWVGILAHGSRASAGFSILHCGRVVRGWPDAW